MLSLQRKATQAVKRAGLMTAGSLLCVVGVGFLTAAAWLQLSLTFSDALSALIIAVVYLGLGFLAMGLSKSEMQGSEPTQLHVSEPKSDAPPIMQAFLYGIQAGANAKSPKR